MEINRETAMRLWNNTFGKKTKVIDFAGRTIVKGAYDDRNSDFGWNIDHILPQSRGGKTADYNLICCHMLTNDEKADSFPSFKANDKLFQIVKVENHYEIREVNKKSNIKNPEQEEIINFLDSASGIRLFDELNDLQNKDKFVGSVLIRLRGVGNSAVVDFIERIFEEENVSFSTSRYYSNETRIVVKNYDMPMKEDISQLLDKCIVLNTYIKYYFQQLNYVNDYDIRYQVNCYENKIDMCHNYQVIDFDNYNSNIENALFINELVYVNSEAKDRLPNLIFSSEYNNYDYTYQKLSSNLLKEVRE